MIDQIKVDRKRSYVSHFSTGNWNPYFLFGQPAYHLWSYTFCGPPQFHILIQTNIQSKFWTIPHPCHVDRMNDTRLWKYYLGPNFVCILMFFCLCQREMTRHDTTNDSTRQNWNPFRGRTSASPDWYPLPLRSNTSRFQPVLVEVATN